MIPVVLLVHEQHGDGDVAPTVHLAVVGAAGTIAAASAVSMSIIAARRNDGRAVWIGMAFSVVATLLSIDGNGYPNRRPAGELDLEVRILTVGRPRAVFGEAAA